MDRGRTMDDDDLFAELERKRAEMRELLVLQVRVMRETLKLMDEIQRTEIQSNSAVRRSVAGRRAL